MAEKAPCRWAQHNHRTPRWPDCKHRLLVHLHREIQAQCDGCPCHEPEPAKDTPGCQWEQDWEGNWEASCSLYWVGDDIGGMNFCPNCGRTVAETPYTEPPADDEEEEPGTRTDPPKVHDKP